MGGWGLFDDYERGRGGEKGEGKNKNRQPSGHNYETKHNTTNA